MPNEFHFEVAFDAAWVQKCITEGAEKLIVSGTLSLQGDHTILLRGFTKGDTPLNYAVKGCPMPCQPPNN